MNICRYGIAVYGLLGQIFDYLFTFNVNRVVHVVRYFLHSVTSDAELLLVHQLSSRHRVHDFWAVNTIQLLAIYFGGGGPVIIDHVLGSCSLRAIIIHRMVCHSFLFNR